MAFGENLKIAREQRGLTQKQLGEKIGVTGVAIMRYEQNVRVPKPQKLFELAKSLNVNEAWLMGYLPNMERNEVSEIDEAVQNVYPEFQQGETIANHIERMKEKQEHQHLEKYRQLNNDGKEYINEQVDFALAQDRYTDQKKGG